MRATGLVLTVVVGMVFAGCSNNTSSDAGSSATSAAPAAVAAGAATTIPLPTTVVVPTQLDARDEWGDPIDAEPLLPPAKQQLIDALDPGTPCADDTTPVTPVPGDGQLVLQVVRVVAGCLVIDSTVVPAGDLDALAATAAEQSDVVAASEATHPYIDEVTAAAPGPDPEIGDQQWWLDDLNVAGLDALSVEPATPKVRVAVIDSGIDDTNPDLAGLVVGRVPWAPAPTGNPDSRQAHGTHVAGIIAAAADNSLEGRGVARHVEFLDVNYGDQVAPSVSELIDWAVDHGADVINMSFCEYGSNQDLPCRDKPAGSTAASIAYARSRGVLLFAAAGNCGPTNYNKDGAVQCDRVENRVTYPAAYNGVIAVGAYDRNGTIAGFSSANDSVDVSAPGDQIRSTVFAQTTRTKDGTSQATPMVTGAAAALLAHRPDINPGRILSGLFAIVRDAGDKGWDRQFGSGKIDPLEVARRIDAGTPPPSTTLASPYPLLTGATGELVTSLQVALTAAGYDLAEPDGQFGALTAAAVSAFQTDQGLVASGVVDEKLFDLAISEAAKAPACAFAAVTATQGLEPGWVWDGTVRCAPGWAIASAYLPDTAAGMHYLFRVRGGSWQLASSTNGRAATTVLAIGTALSPDRFSVLFGAPGWPGRVSSADEVARFITVDSIASAGTLPEAWEYVQMWLDNDGFDVWTTWLYDGGFGQGGVQEQCVFVDTSNFAGAPHWECVWSANTGDMLQWIIVVDKQLTQATMVTVGVD